MSKLADAFRAAGIHNVFALTGHGQVYISWFPSDRVFSARYQVVRRGYRTDPNAHWHDNGHKTFSYYGGAQYKREALAQAKAWAKDRYGIPEDAWAPSPFGGGDFVQRDLLESRKAEVGYGRKRSA
jgi:hypothetical protein